MKLAIPLTLALILGLVVAFSGQVVAEPTGPDSVNTSTPESRGSGNPYEINAQAGNITALSIDATSVTKSWQGYYGNVTGLITLDDADNYTFYDWAFSSPQGEVYAANGSSVTWNNIKCVNFTADPAVDGLNLSTLESMYGMNSWDTDGVDETFSATYSNTTGFYVGAVLINNDDQCPQVNTYVNETEDTTRFFEVLLTDNVSVVYAAILEQEYDGFQAHTAGHDFQMIVGEDGHNSDIDATPYYFYVELG